MSAAFNPADVQGNILRGYRKQRVRYLMLEITDRNAARRWLTASLKGSDGVPQITTEGQKRWERKPDSCFNIGLTYGGLRALGTPAASLADFPIEFVEGMSKRAPKLGDAGPSAPENWDEPFNDPAKIHLIASIYVGDVKKPDAAAEIAQLDAIQRAAISDKWGVRLLDGAREGWCFNGDYVHFNYTDNISQPKFEEIHDIGSHEDKQPVAPLGTVLLGYPTNFEGLKWRVPQPVELGHNGSFNAFRVLEQDVVGFEKYLDKAATELLGHAKVNELLPPGAEANIKGEDGQGLSRHGALREVVAAAMCGRWRNGVPLALSPDTPNPPQPVSKTNFDYNSSSSCPYGSHIRRCNPRGAQIVQRVANHSRRLVRRGMPYGPAYVHDPLRPRDPREEKRGLLGNFIGANLGAQFEAMSCDWLNLGLQDPRVTGSNDPLLGANEPATSWFDLPLKSGAAIRLRGLPRFVTARGGAYTFLPSISAIRYLGALTG